MGWAIGFVDGRDVGYGVPCQCEHPDCKAKIDRGLSFACGGFPSNEFGCGLFFCGKHMFGYEDEYGEWHQACEICTYNGELGSENWHKFKKLFDRKPDLPVWMRWKLKDNSWADWREKNPREVDKIICCLDVKRSSSRGA